MRNGFRQAPQPNRKERLAAYEKRIENLEMASRITQMMTQQLLQNSRNLQEDLGRALGLLNETQYKLLAIQEVAGLDVPRLTEIVNAKRLTDFNEASDREDAEKQFTVGTTVEQDSTVILTSKTEEPDRGFFRSRIEIARCGVPDLIKAFMGREAGAKAIVKLNGVDHEVELLGVRNPPPAVEEAPAEDETTSESELDVGSNGAADVSPQVEAVQVTGNA